MRAMPGSVAGAEDGTEGIAVNEESWYLGDGGFAVRHMEDEAHIAAKKVP